MVAKEPDDAFASGMWLVYIRLIESANASLVQLLEEEAPGIQIDAGIRNRKDRYQLAELERQYDHLWLVVYSMFQWCLLQSRIQVKGEA